MNSKEIIKIIENSKSKYDALLQMYGYTNKRTYDFIDEFILKNNINIEHWYENANYKTKCVNCGKDIEVLPSQYKKSKTYNFFCNGSCSTSFNNKKRKLTEETKNKIGESISRYYTTKESHDNSSKYVGKCVICDKEFRRLRFKNKRISKSKTCSLECQIKQRTENGRKNMKERIEKGLHNGWKTRNITSYPEKFFIDVLNNNKIKFQHNYPVNKRDLGLDDSYNYFLDFYIEDKKIDLEIDGNQHKYRKEHDKKRDDLLKKNGFIVYRIQWKNIKSDNGKKYIKEEIDKFLEFYKNN